MNPINILLVDDRPENLLALEAVLKDPAYRLVRAKSGAEALSHLGRDEFALVLLDVQMPGMDGFETARRIKRDARLRDVPIIFITAINKDPVHVFRGYDTGAVDYLMKPFDDYLLRSKVTVLADLYDKSRRIRQQQDELTRTNSELQREVRVREQTENALRLAHMDLELRVQERTAALASSNHALQQEIVERRRTEDQLQTSLREKEVLLKEIHHRVKNNLQVVSSLLSLQSDAIKDPAVLSLFVDSQNRIHSMALVHEKLYGTKDFSFVEMGLYVRSLSTHLFRSYAVPGETINLRIEAEDVRMTIDSAIPCGLLLNELISNALKHAFPNGRRGVVAIRLSRPAGDDVLLVVEDDGIGIPPEIALDAADTLGLRLVSALIEQLDATVELDRSVGTRFTIRFRPATAIRASVGHNSHPSLPPVPERV